MKLESRAFPNGGTIPETYSPQGDNASPPLAWADVPEDAARLALVVDDPDAPDGTLVHWLVYDIPPDVSQLEKGAGVPHPRVNGALQGKNSFGEIGYRGPTPPSGTHRYYFHLYALDTKIDLPPGATREQLEAAMRGHELDECQHLGKFQRQ